MSDVVGRLAALMNEHDLARATALIHQDYRSEQPVHPGRAFVGRAQMGANWKAMFDGIPDFHAEMVRSVQDGETVWTEWHWTGSRSDGEPLRCAGSLRSRCSRTRSSPAGCTWKRSSETTPGSRTPYRSSRGVDLRALGANRSEATDAGLEPRWECRQPGP